MKNIVINALYILSMVLFLIWFVRQALGMFNVSKFSLSNERFKSIQNRLLIVGVILLGAVIAYVRSGF